MAAGTRIIKKIYSLSASAVAAFIFLVLCRTGESFTMEMAHKPKGYTSVGAFTTQRPQTSSDLYDPSLRSPSSKKAVAIDIGIKRSKREILGTRMNDLVWKKVRNKLESNRGRNANKVKGVRTLEEFNQIVGCEDEKVVAVMFHAQWCKACKAVLPRFHQMARRYPDVVFVDVPVMESNSKLLKALGVSKFPFGHIYHPSKGLVCESPVVRKVMPDFEEKLRSYVT